MKIYCNTKQNPALPFCGTHPKPHGGNVLSNHYHSRFDPKLGRGICAICRIPCACVACTPMMYQLQISDSSSKKQARYKPITSCTYWTFPGSYNNWNFIHLSQKSIPFEAFDEIHQVVLDGINDNLESLILSDKDSSINTDYTKTKGYYDIKFISEE